MLRNVFRILIAFYISGIAYVAFVEGKIFRWKFVTEVLLLKKYPGWSEFLASFAAVLLVGIFIYPLMRRMNTIMFVGVACISCMACYIPYDRVHNSWLALLAGSRDYITFPVLQYAVFFAAGVLFGTAGIKVLASKDAKKLYTNCTAAILRAKSCVMKTATTIQENAEDIYAEAQQINEERAAAEEVVTDVEEVDAEEADANETDVEESFKETETEEA